MHQDYTSTDSELEPLGRHLVSMVQVDSEQYLIALEDEWGSIFVLEENNFRILKFDEFYEQSKLLITEPHYPVFDYIKAMLLSLAFAPCDDVLILGLGGGSLVRAVHHFCRGSSITVVEIRPAVVELAFKYFLMPSSSTIKLVSGDAKNYLTTTERKYDLIFADLFWAMRMDQIQSTRQFFKSCKQKLRAHGWLAVNYELHSEINDKLLRIIFRYFDDVFLCAIPSGNAVILAGSVAASGGMEVFLSRLPTIEARLDCKMDILRLKLQQLSNPNNI